MARTTSRHPNPDSPIAPRLDAAIQSHRRQTHAVRFQTQRRLPSLSAKNMHSTPSRHAVEVPSLGLLCPARIETETPRPAPVATLPRLPSLPAGRLRRRSPPVLANQIHPAVRSLPITPHQVRSPQPAATEC